MSSSRVTLRWVLTALAVALVVAALVVSGARWMLGRLDGQRLATAVEQSLDATLTVDDLQGRLQRLDPGVTARGLRIVSRDGPNGETRPLLEVGNAALRLDTLSSLLHGQPVFARARLGAVTVHLYQDDAGGWRWPGVASGGAASGNFTAGGLDRWLGLLLRQRLSVEDVRVVLHGRDGELTLTAPRLLVAGQGSRVHVEGQWFVEGQKTRSLSVVMEVQPGADGLEDFDAALQARMDLGSLDRLGQLLSHGNAVRLDRVSGQASLWARWQKARIADARLRVSVPSLSLDSDDGPVVLEDIGARAQWRRAPSGEGWQAWVNALSLRDADQSATVLPSRLALRGDDRGWWLRSTPFSLEALASLGRRLPLPDAAQRALDALQPRGRVQGLQVGRQDGAWQVEAALQEAAVEPWQNVPGGGPLDAWVVADGEQGHVDFSGGQGMTLDFPEIFPDPLVLDAAGGRVDWSLAERQPLVTGRNLHVRWREAPVDGGFSLRLPGNNADRRPGRFTLDLAMRDVDAVKTPLGEWLPLELFDTDLRDFLTGGIRGRVPRGSLHVEQRLDKEAMADDGNEDVGDDLGTRTRLTLDLDIEQGRLPYDPEWPALEAVSGHLRMVDDTLQARVDHAETRGLVSEGAKVTMADKRLRVDGPVNGPVQALLQFLAAAPIDGLDDFADWRGDGRVAGDLQVEVPLDSPGKGDPPVTVDVGAQVDAPSLRLPQSGLVLGNVNGRLRYRHADDTDTLTGQLGARAFQGPLLATFDVGGAGVTFEGRALARGLLSWGGVGSLSGLLEGYFPYSAQLDLSGASPRLTLDSDLQGLAIKLPAPFGKTAAAQVPLHLEAAPDPRRVDVTLRNRLRLRWRALGPDVGQGQAWLEQWPATLPTWPGDRGWTVDWRTPRLPLTAWQKALAGLGAGPASGDGTSSGKGLRRLSLQTPCLDYAGRCIGDLQARVTPLSPQGWAVGLQGSVVAGQASYHQRRVKPVSVQLSRLDLDALMPEVPPAKLSREIATAPEPQPLPDWVARLPAGQVEIATLIRGGQRFGPFSAGWEASPGRLRIAPVSLTLGDINGRGELVWEASGDAASLTRSRLTLDGGDLGSALRALGQPVAVRSRRTQVQSQLAWPGAPWQFALARSRGNIDAELDDGSFLTLDSPSARLIGLLNVDNLLRRLRLDFSDVTDQGTAFDSVRGDATLYDGRLETRGPVKIDGASTQFSLDGSVDLMARRLDLMLGVTVPVSQNLPLAAVLAGAPYVGGALYLADKLLGGWLDQVTRIYYRVQGPWTSPRITVENAE
ncbi:MAG: hypothetical protein AWU55_1153 [Halomonadaceae bacterium T82-2]|nr:MAG: hypothetical protein AWU55_1153 [Halomonadaceae bacterium T82-2]